MLNAVLKLSIKRTQKFYNLGFMLRLREVVRLSLSLCSRSFITSGPAGRASAISSAKEGKSGSIYNLAKNK